MDGNEFIKDLRRLCRRHCVQIAVSGYDVIQLWPLDRDEPEIHSNGIQGKDGVEYNEEKDDQLLDIPAFLRRGID